MTLLALPPTASAEKIETLSLKIGVSSALQSKHSANGGVNNAKKTKKDAISINGAISFNTPYSDVFKPYLDLNSSDYKDKRVIIPGMGLRYQFSLKEPFIKPFYSLGVGYAFLDWSTLPVNGFLSDSDKGESVVFTTQGGVNLVFNEELTLGISLRYDAFSIDTTIVDNNRVTTLQDRGGVTLFAGLQYRFGTAPKIVIDDDHDGVLNGTDQCPGTLLYVYVNEAGCPQYRFHINLDFKFATYNIQNIINHPRFNTVSFLQKNQHYSVRIIGYTDNRGSTSFNQRLSEMRAKEAQDYLFSQGIEKERIHILGRGEKEALFDNDTVEHRQANRRIKIEFYRSILGKE
jgi:opacity protein-like surface antigen